jgi:hypothetical protein
MAGTQQQTEVASSASPNGAPSPWARWHRYVLGFCLVIFTLELGFVLLIFPWQHAWETSWVPVHSHALAELWMNRYFRGALSGLGLLNIYIGLGELVRQLRALFGRR